MTVPTSDNREQYEGNGSATTFDYAFRIFKAEDLTVIKTDAQGNELTLVLGTHYSVSGTGNENGGTVTYPLSGDPLAAGETLTILRVIAITQETDLRNQGAYYPETIEDELDRGRMIDQQQQEELGRSLKKSEGGEHYDAQGKRITGLAMPADNKDAMSKEAVIEYFKGLESGALGDTSRVKATGTEDERALADWMKALGYPATSTGTQTLTDALDSRVIFVSTIADLLAIDLPTIQPGQLKWIGSEELVIYVDGSTGSDINDGFEAAAPKATLQSAIDRLAVFGPYLNGQFVIQLAAGTYARGRFPDDGIPSDNPIIIRGPDVGGHPNIPTAIISEGNTGIVGDGILFKNETKVTAKDIYFVGWDGSSSGGGIQCATYCELYLENCHFDTCYWGASALGGSKLDVKGGIFEKCGYLDNNPSNGAGTRTLFNSSHSIGTQNAGTLSNGPIFRNCATACFAQEGSTGHCDYATIEDCSRGLEANVNSRFNYSGTSFKRNTVDVFCNNSHVFTNNPAYGTGADESSLRYVVNNFGASGGLSYFKDHEEAYSVARRVYAIDYVNTLYNSTTSTAFHTSTLAGGMWRNVRLSTTPGRAINIKITGALNGANDVKRINLRLGSALAQLSFTASDSGVFEAEGTIYFTDREEQFLTLRGYRHLSPAIRVGSAVANEALAADTPLTVEAQVLNTSDSIRIYTVEASLLG